MPYNIWIVAHVCPQRGNFLRINGKMTLAPLEPAARFDSGTPAVNQNARCAMIGLMLGPGIEHYNMCDGYPVSEYKFNFLYAR